MAARASAGCACVILPNAAPPTHRAQGKCSTWPPKTEGTSRTRTLGETALRGTPRATWWSGSTGGPASSLGKSSGNRTLREQQHLLERPAGGGSTTKASDNHSTNAHRWVQQDGTSGSSGALQQMSKQIKTVCIYIYVLCLCIGCVRLAAMQVRVEYTCTKHWMSLDWTPHFI